MKDLSLHPCFNEGARHKYARVHLPVAPRCNMQCNYCNRLYDCCNESRPGVTSSILKPLQASYYFKALKQKLDNLSVVGIAGPGDPFANPNETLATIGLIEKEFPDMIFCLSSNGLDLAPYIDRIAKLNVSHVTITINSLNVDTLEKIYSWVRYENKIYRGKEAARLLLERQLHCIKELKGKGIIVKINSVVIPGINDGDMEELAQKVSAMGADTMNCIPMYPTAGSLFENEKEPSREMMKRIRSQISRYIKPMSHCARCRADAAGLLGHDDSDAMDMVRQFSTLVISREASKTKVAVATGDGQRVDLHLGEAAELWIYEKTRNGYRFIEKRKTAEANVCNDKWIALSENALADCQAVLVSGVGKYPTAILQKKGIRVIQMKGLIDTGLDAVYRQQPIIPICKAAPFKCGATCKGDQKGCG